MTRSCLILGGKGFVGSAVTRAALRHGWDAVPAGRADLAALSGRTWDLIINANGNSKKFLSDRDPNLDFDLSVRSVAHSLHDFQYARYVFLSTVDVYPDKAQPAANAETAVIDPFLLSRYGHHKWMAEQLVRFNAPEALVVRLAGFVGQGLKKNPIFDLLTGAALRVHPDSAYQYLNSDAMADILFRLIDQVPGGGIYNLAGDGLVSLREVAAMIPEARIPENDTDLRRERYEINIAKVKGLCDVPGTRNAVMTFIEDVLKGRIVLA